MNTAERHDAITEDTNESVIHVAPDLVEIRRNGGLAALVGVVASGVAIAYLSRAATTGAVVDWMLFALMGLIGAGFLRAFFDARTPLLVADSQGLRVRLGRAWRGLPWGALEAIEHSPRRGLLRDGKIVMLPHNPDRVLAELDSSGRRQARLNAKMYGAPFALPLGLSTRVGTSSEDLTTSLRQLAGGGTRILETSPEAAGEVTSKAQPTGSLAPTVPVASAVAEAEADVSLDEESSEAPDAEKSRRSPRLVLASMISWFSTRPRSAEVAPGDAEDSEAVDESDGSGDGTDQPAPAARQLTINPVIASATPAPLRETRSGSRAEVRSDLGVAPQAGVADGDDASVDLPEGRELRRRGSVNLVEEVESWGDRVRPIATAKATVEPLVIDDYAVEPAADPVIGPDITAARTRIGLSVDALADRTRIRPHVIESIEVDDFVPCGGDFYARGHLRTLARVLGLDDGALLKAYDERYADAPINPRRVFEAELATGSSGGIRSTRGGPNWSVLIAAIMTLVLAWSIARLVMDDPAPVQDPVSLSNGSGGPPQAGTAENVTLKVTATSETHLTVTNARGKVIFDDDVEYGEVHRLDVTPPVSVKAADAGAVDVEIDGESQGALGDDGREVEKTFRADDD